jgi:molybdopterin biosynthesis enzyme MoaB
LFLLQSFTIYISAWSYPTFKTESPFYNAMSSTTLKAAILIISDTASQNPTSDVTGNILKDIFDTEGRGQWGVVETKIVPDNIDQIQHAVTQWTDQLDVVTNLILTSGGTGFAVKDNTPEVRELIFLSSWSIECN